MSSYESSEFAEYRRFDAEHKLCITVSVDDFASETLQDAVNDFGFEFLTTNEELACTLGADQTPAAEIRRREIDAYMCGHRLFFLKMGQHGAYSFDITLARPRRDWDSGCVGVLIVTRKTWESHFPQMCFARTVVLRMVRHLFVELTESVLNGTVYRADVLFQNDCFDSCGNFMSCEEALATMQRQYPAVRYRQDQFEATGYRLIN